MVERTPRLVGEARQAMAAELAGRYHDGASIRSLARESGVLRPSAKIAAGGRR